MSPDAEIVGVRFFKSVIASKSAFTYADAQKRMDDKYDSFMTFDSFVLKIRRSMKDPITSSIRLLNQLAVKLRAKRMAAGALDLSSPEVRIQLESSETSGPMDIEQKQLLATNTLVYVFHYRKNALISRSERSSCYWRTSVSRSISTIRFRALLF